MQTIRTPEKEAALLEALRERPVFAAACRKARIGKQAFYDWRRDDPEFDRRVVDARNEGLDALEDALATRGAKDDTTAAIFLLKSLRREIYGDKITHEIALTATAEWIAFRSALLRVLDRHPAVKDELLAELLRAGDPAAPTLSAIGGAR